MPFFSHHLSRLSRDLSRIMVPSHLRILFISYESITHMPNIYIARLGRLSDNWLFSACLWGVSLFVDFLILLKSAVKTIPSYIWRSTRAWLAQRDLQRYAEEYQILRNIWELNDKRRFTFLAIDARSSGDNRHLVSEIGASWWCHDDAQEERKTIHWRIINSSLPLKNIKVHQSYSFRH